MVIVMALSTFAEHLKPETALKAATTFFNNNGRKTSQLTDISKQAGFANLYIFAAENGFVVMSADDRAKPILGYSFTNKFETENMLENISSWLQGYSDEIQRLIDSNEKASSETTKLWKDLISGKPDAAKTTTVVAALIKTKWNQGSPYNYFCPTGTYTGCVATAMAQVMKYWNYPTKGVGSHSYTHSTYGTQSVNFGNTTYNWSSMINSYSSEYTSEQREAMAKLMYHCGVSVDMNYGTSASGAQSFKVAIALRSYFNYDLNLCYEEKSSYSDDAWISKLKEDLDASRPIYYSGSNSNSGHAFVCDGYDSSDNFHFNWGWGGNQDGYWTIGALNPGSGGAGSGSGTYNLNNAAIFGVRPSQCTASVPTELGYTLNGTRNVTLEWTAGTNAASYNIYRNSYYIGNTSTTTFTETAPFGTNIYYIRSVDASGNLSLASNYATVTIDYQTPVVSDLRVSRSGNNASLSWTTPYCYPETESEILTYGEGDIYYSWTSICYAHRYLAEDIAQYANMLIFKTSTYVNYTGTYTVYIYTGTKNNKPDPDALASTATIYCTSDTGWKELILNEPVTISGNKDLWIVMKQENTGVTYPTPSFNLDTYNENACYTGSSPTQISPISNSYKISWLIKAYLTDGTHTYNLYDGNTKLNNTAISSTSYTAPSPVNGIHTYTLKTIYNNGETAASNTATLVIGENTYAGSLALTGNDNLIVASGAKLTVNGTLSNTTADNLIIEDNGQLVTNNAVQGTIKKNIAGYGQSKGNYYLIASPVNNLAPSSSNGLINGTTGAGNNTYDLYYFNQNQEQEWRNYEAGAFPLVAGRGYLYANSNDVTLSFAGELTATKSDIDLVYNEDADFAGWNLIGNPFPCNVTINKPFYRMADGGEALSTNTEDGSIAPMEGVFVQATASGQTLTFTKEAADANIYSGDQLTISVRNSSRGNIIDNAIIRFDEGDMLGKLMLNPENSKLYIPQNGNDYAVVQGHAKNEIPINFKAATISYFSLTINAKGFFSYLHLIDKVTGKDIDMLLEDEYSFIGSPRDYENRFILKFNYKSDNTADDEIFAYQYGDEITVIGDGTLQIFDVTGRFIMSYEINGNKNINVSTLSKGFYILRIAGNEVKTQKIVLK